MKILIKIVWQLLENEIYDVAQKQQFNFRLHFQFFFLFAAKKVISTVFDCCQYATVHQNALNLLLF